MQKSFLYQDKNIFYRIEGKGKPVVLIHGFGEDNHIWDAQINFLKEHCLLIVPDLPGSGQSEMLQVSSYQLQVASCQLPETDNLQPATISIDDYADCIKALLEHENISSCIILGHSMGGYITLAFAEKYSNLLSGFGLIHSTAFADNEEKKANRLKGIEMMEEYGAYAFLKNMIPNLFFKKFKEANPEKIASLIESAKQFTKKTCQQYYKAMMNRPDRTAILKNSRLPILFIIGKEDVAVPLNDSMQQVSLPQCSYFHILENVGHMGMLEVTDEVNKFLLSFIKESGYHN